MITRLVAAVELLKPKLLGLDLALDPAVEDFDHGRARLQALGPHRPDGIRGYVCPGIDHVPPKDTAGNGAVQSSGGLQHRPDLTPDGWLGSMPWFRIVRLAIPDCPPFYSGSSGFVFRIVR
jgi:hypothetical protein